MRYVLDASALLAAMFREACAEAVSARFGEACIGAVNLAEIIAKLAERGIAEAEISELIDDLDLEIALELIR